MTDRDKNIINRSKKIAIIGMPGAGKSHISAAVSELKPGYKVIHTDDYIDDVKTLTKVAKASIHDSYIIEGVGVYDLLCYGGIYPDLILDVKAEDSLIEARYKDRGKDRPVNFERKLQSTWQTYVDQCIKSKAVMPQILTIK
jgi:adenylate kinase